MSEMYITPEQTQLHSLWPEVPAMKGLETKEPLQATINDPALDLILPKGFVAVKDTQAVSEVEPAVFQEVDNRPKLLPPVEFNLSQAVSDFLFLQQQFMKSRIEQSQENLSIEHEKYQQLHDELMKKHYEASEKLDNNKTWDALQNVGGYLSSAVTIAAGVSLGVGASGAILVSAGAFTLLNQVSGGIFSKGISNITGANESSVDVAFSLVSFALGAGSALAGKTVSAGLNAARVGSYAIENVAHVGQEYNKSQVTNLEAESDALNNQLSTLRIEGSEEQDKIKEYLRMLERLVSHTSQIRDDSYKLSKALLVR